jgi:hypothetical protein
MTRSTDTSELYTFVVHTNLYSGNFERELTAFITGQIGECEVGDGKAELFKEDLGDDPLVELFDRMIKQMPDEDNGCMRPCVIYPSPNRGNNGMGVHGDITDAASKKKFKYPAYESVAIYFDEKPTKEMIDLMKARSKIYADEHAKGDMKILGFQLLKSITKTETIYDEEELTV